MSYTVIKSHFIPIQRYNRKFCHNRKFRQQKQLEKGRKMKKNPGKNLTQVLMMRFYIMHQIGLLTNYPKLLGRSLWIQRSNFQLILP